MVADMTGKSHNSADDALAPVIARAFAAACARVTASYVPSASTATSLGWLADWRAATQTASGKPETLQKLPG